MKLVVFAYDFEHWKTQTTLFNLVVHGFKISRIIAAPFRELNMPPSTIRVIPIGRYLTHPRLIAERFDIPYSVTPHDSQECLDILGRGDYDLGVVAGARILGEDVIAQLRHGILNMHPGLLPESRGLDIIKWALVDKFPLGASLHFIDKNVDRGRLVAKEQVTIYRTDSLTEIGVRIQHLEQALLMKLLPAITKYQITQNDCPTLEKGKLYKVMPRSVEYDLPLKFLDYKLRYGGQDV